MFKVYQCQGKVIFSQASVILSTIGLMATRSVHFLLECFLFSDCTYHFLSFISSKKRTTIESVSDVLPYIVLYSEVVTPLIKCRFLLLSNTLFTSGRSRTWLNLKFDEVYIWGIRGHENLVFNGCLVGFVFQGTSLITLNNYHFVGLRHWGEFQG